MGLLHHALAYVLGGLTFLPLVILAIFAHAYYTLPVVDPAEARREQDEQLQESVAGPVDLSKLPAVLQKPDRERDAAAGYFAISREYVAGGVNGKPPERLTPAGEVIATESPSVYQSMYRSIFERNKAQGPSFDTAGGNIKATKKARNVFYVVLRLGHLMLYDNADQLEVRHVISLGLYEVDVYGGSEKIPEGELWVKRNCIRLKMRDSDYTLRDSKPYYLFSDNCSEKEDFYHALIQNQHRSSTTGQPAVVPLKFEPEHMVKLVQNLHGSEELMQTRWFNALLGRIFLSLYKTKEVHAFIHAKIMKKLTRIQTPSFIEEIKVGRIDMGNAAPLFTNPKLRELTLDGELVLEMDVRYSGNFRLEIAAQVLIDLGKRFNVRRIDVLLSGLLKSLEGHLLIKVKPPPCNRLWISFESMPKLDLSIEPIVSSRQITYGIILRTIESRIREVLGETLVYPNWDDIPFSHTEGDSVRGGLWDFHAAGQKPSKSASTSAVAEQEKESLVAGTDTLPKSQSTPALVRRRPVGTSINGKAKSTKSSADSASISSGREIPASGSKPKAMRSSSSGGTSPPLVSMSPTHANAFRDDGQGSLPDAASAMKGLSSHSSSTSSTPLPTDPQALDPSFEADETVDHKDMDEQDVFAMDMPADETSRAGSESHRSSRRNGSKTSINVEGFGNAPIPDSPPKKTKTFVANAQVATAAAKKWGYDFVAKRASTMPHNNAQANDSNSDLSSVASVQSMPIGRGQPLPPPGQPLPGPQRKGWAGALGSIGRKKVPSHTPSISGLTSEARDAALKAAKDATEAIPPLPPRRSTEASSLASVPGSPTVAHSRKGSQHSRRGSTMASRSSVDEKTAGVDKDKDNVLVIKAPESDSEALKVDVEEKPAPQAVPIDTSQKMEIEEEETDATGSAISTPPSEEKVPEVVDERTPTQKGGGGDGVVESLQTRDSDRDSLEMLQTLVH